MSVYPCLEHFKDKAVYLRYLLACQNVGCGIVASGSRVFGGNLGCSCGGVCEQRLSIENADFASVCGVVEGGADTVGRCSEVVREDGVGAAVGCSDARRVGAAWSSAGGHDSACTASSGHGIVAGVGEDVGGLGCTSGATGLGDGKGLEVRECDEGIRQFDRSMTESELRQEINVVSVGLSDVKQMRKDKNKRRKLNRKHRRDAGVASSGTVPDSGLRGGVNVGNCGSSASPEPLWRRGALVETVPGLGSRDQGYFAEIAKEKRIRLRESRAEMLVKQNELAMLRAERELKVLEAADIEVEKRKYVTSLRAATERNMVSIEKTHAQLVATDNVPRSDLDHDVHTVLTGDVPGLSSGSISPNSSASMAEFRACQKENLDKQEKIDRMLEAFKKLGISETTIPFVGKKEWTVNSQGTLGCAAEEALDELMPGGFAIDGNPYVEKGDKVGVMSVGQWGF